MFACRLRLLQALAFCLAGLCLAVKAQPAPPAGGLQSNNRPALLTSNPVNQVLPAERAFIVEAFATTTDSVLLHWAIQPGYYLYRKNLQVSDAAGMALTATLPQGRAITDEFFGNVEVYYDQLELEVPVDAASTARKHISLTIDYQGCAEDLYCYPPLQKQLDVPLP